MYMEERTKKAIEVINKYYEKEEKEEKEVSDTLVKGSITFDKYLKQMKKMKKALVIYHRPDFDGVFSGSIAKMALEKNEFIVDLVGFNYGDPTPNLAEVIINYQVVVMVDITLLPESMSFLHKQEECEVIWIDHHETAITSSIEGGYSDMKGVREVGTAACELTWEYFYPTLETPKVIQYVGTYDVWNQSKFDWENETLPVQYALRAEYGVSIDALELDFERLLNLNNLDELITPGKLIIKYQERVWKTAVKNYSFEITVAGYLRGICIMSTEFSSNVFNSVSKDYDIMCVVNKRGDIYQTSLYISPEKIKAFSAGKYLKENYGGGGHAGAAGCTLNLDQFIELIENKRI